MALFSISYGWSNVTKWSNVIENRKIRAQGDVFGKKFCALTAFGSKETGRSRKNTQLKKKIHLNPMPESKVMTNGPDASLRTRNVHRGVYTIKHGTLLPQTGPDASLPVKRATRPETGQTDPT
jgi:hypothetical protein